VNGKNLLLAALSRMGRIAEERGLDWRAGGRGQTWGKGWDNPHFELMKGYKQSA
jgi:hypothetical protein